MKQELHVIFRGRVQGVGFRWTVVDCAEKFHLAGTVQNLADGSVEVFAQGAIEPLSAFLSSIEKDVGFAHIASMKVEYTPLTHTFSGFKII